LLEAERGFVSGAPAHVAVAYAVGAALVAGFGLWALRGLRKAEAAG
jgi:hypothetical protein